MREFFTCYRWPLVTFLLAACLGYAARSAIGRVYGAAEAVDLLNALSRAGLYLGSAIATASATIIALMLTLIGMIRRINTDFDQGPIVTSRWWRAFPRSPCWSRCSC
ncbi:hypothetical protein [Erythrobacter sp. SD-21]|uniref:hypothetical protein n=1 Tax=Erythrobacter sp. SD-21 TaxID=161528 RepID=UPI001F2836BD|nr:hypothetical protein [Erythrobacter sp. SD-21]